jgi:hypothetical protein
MIVYERTPRNADESSWRGVSKVHVRTQKCFGGLREIQGGARHHFQQDVHQFAGAGHRAAGHPQGASDRSLEPHPLTLFAPTFVSKPSSADVRQLLETGQREVEGLAM